MRDAIARMLEPRSIAVVGASRDPSKRGYQNIRALQDSGYPHPIYPVNPRESEVCGLPAYPSVADIGRPVDLALVVTPAHTTPGVIRDCGEAGVAGAVVVAVGFREMGAAGGELEAELMAEARAAGVRVVGPNTSGLFNLSERLNLVGLHEVPAGDVAFLSQSGNMLLSVVEQARHESGIGFGVYVGVGNESDVAYHEWIRHLGTDPATRAIAIYCEGFRDGREFFDVARATTPVKPVVLLKGGWSAAGQRSALSHTGALTGSSAVTRAALRQAGVTVVERSDELLAVTEALVKCPTPRGPRVAVLADGGGHATLAVDALAAAPGLELPELEDDTRATLRALLGPAANTRNPVDVAGATDHDPAIFASALDSVIADPNVDAVLMVGIFGGYAARFSADLAPVEERAATRLADLAAASGKPLVVQSAYAQRRPEAHDLLRRGGVPVHASIDIAVRALRAVVERASFLAAARRPPEPRVGTAARHAPDGVRRTLTEAQARELLASEGVDTGPWRLATDADEAVAAAERFGGPVAMKVVSPQILHKSDVGGVRLGVAGAAAVRAAFTELLGVAGGVTGASVDGVLVCPMAAPGLELLVGLNEDAQFGPAITVGLGGTLVEAIGDVSTRVLPIDARDAEEMLAELRGARLLDGFRGRPAVDRGAIVALLLSVGEVGLRRPDIAELDLNPVIARADGLTIVDARVALSGARADADGVRAAAG